MALSKPASSGDLSKHSDSTKEDDKKKKKLSKKKQQQYDFEPLIYPGITCLKFGKTGTPHERLFSMSGDMHFLHWRSGWFSNKLGTINEVEMEKVIRITKGQTTYSFQKWNNQFAEAANKSLSIVYIVDGEEKCLDLIAPTDEIFALLYRGLKQVVKKLDNELSTMSSDTLLMKSLWNKADRDHDGHLTLKEIMDLVAAANIKLADKEVTRLFHVYDVDKSGTLEFEEFIEFMRDLQKRPEIEAIWLALINGTPLPNPSYPLPLDETFDDFHSILPVEKFIDFWATYQGATLTRLDVTNLFNDAQGAKVSAWGRKIAKKRNKASKRLSKRKEDPDKVVEDTYDIDPDLMEITYMKFMAVLSSYKFSLYDYIKTTKYQDMNKPMSYYYMASSHNTYLEGDQLTSTSSVNRYINDLLQGCRCVELDCWDGDMDIPIIYHGHTLTSKIYFKDVITAIKSYGFVNSPYPIVLSIENHCCLKQQMVMAKIMKFILKDSLYLPSDNESEYLPTLEDLKFKVLVKGKRLKPGSLGTEEEDDEDEDDEDEDEDLEEIQRQLEKESMVGHVASDVRALRITEVKPDGKIKKVKVKVHPDLSAITFLGTGKVKSFDASVSNGIRSDWMASYSEGVTNKHFKKEATVKGWTSHNMRHLSRIYPKGSRFDSSNYNPAAAWACGAQLVALNYQTGDLPYHVNFGKFLENGQCGYVLKPEYLLDNTHQTKKSPGIRLTVNVISASCLPKAAHSTNVKEILDPFVELFISTPKTEFTNEARTTTVSDNGFNPVWNQVFHFRVDSPDESYFTFYIKDEDVLSNLFVAFSSLPINRMCPGFHTLQLYGENGGCKDDYKHAKLFVRVDIAPLVDGVSALDVDTVDVNCR